MIILASQSPRRAELLNQVGIRFHAVPANIDETVESDERAADYVERIAISKATAVRAVHPNSTILGADTAVVIDQQILGKPQHRQEAVDMLMLLSGRTHEVLTGVALHTDTLYYRLSLSKVQFRSLSEQEALAYWESGEPQDKAGAYAIQGVGAAFIERIEGSYSGIMGLPLFETMAMLAEADVQTDGGV